MNTVKIENKHYDLSKFKNNHPGGEKFIALFSNQDATNAFQSYHGRHFPHKQMEKYLIKTDTSDMSKIDNKYLKLHKEIKSILLKYHKTDGYAPFSQWVKIIILFLGTVLFEAKTLYTGKKGWIESILLGFLYALIGLNIQHDANHGALSKNPYINEWVGYTQNYIGGSAMMWMYQHVVNHHQYTNIIGMDPDINGGLNYQIEHHLFPRIAHYYYPHISPYVKDWCKENNIKYVHYPTIKENVLSLIRYLKKTNS